MENRRMTRGLVLAPMFLVLVLACPLVAGQERKKESPLPPAASTTSSSPPVDNSGSSQGQQQRGSQVLPKGRSPSVGLVGYFPNVALLTQDNKSVRFYDDMLKGKVVVISFMFTTCSTLCPMTTAHLASVQQYLGDRLGRDVFILSISVDPTNDTPAALKKYARSYKARRGWYFLTGEKENIKIVRAKLGVYEEDKMQHTGLLILGNEATGQWRKIAARRDPTEIANAVMSLIPVKCK